MTECKHRWEPTNFGTKFNPGSYWYQCTRCKKVTYTILLEKKNGH
jgi:hypothetical protein